jgi:uncharacterized protein (TIGR03435 family)
MSLTSATITNSNPRSRFFIEIVRKRCGVTIGTRTRIFLATAGVTPALLMFLGALTVRLASAQAPAGAAQRPTFDAVSIKANKSGDGRSSIGVPSGGRFVGTNAPLALLIDGAYQLGPHQRIGGPDWIDSEGFDIEAKAEGNISAAEMRLMEQTMLADRFGLIAHRETRQLPVYALVVSKAGTLAPADGAKCTAQRAGTPPPSSLPSCGSLMRSPAAGNIGVRYTGRSIPIGYLVRLLGGIADRVVLNQTGLSGTYDLDLEFVPAHMVATQTGPDAGAAGSSAPPSIFTALQEQLGLELMPQTGPVTVLVIDRAEEPSEN